MRTAGTGLALALLLAACGSSSTPKALSSASPSASPTTSALPSPSARPTPTATPMPVAAGNGYAAVQQRHSDGSYSISLVSHDGKVVATATAAARSQGYPGFGPVVSGSDSTLYYLDGDSTVRSLAPDGSSGVVTRLPSSAGTQAHFAVSPDDRRIAVALLTYDPLPPSPPPGVAPSGYRGMRLYVEDIGGANHVDLFTSTTVAEWPVGWHNGALVIAVSSSQIPGLGRNPLPSYAFNGYHVADASNGSRLAELCPQTMGNAEGLPVPDGVLCQTYDGSVYLVGWTATQTLLGHTAQDEDCSALEPGGQHAACGSTSNLLIAAGGATSPLPGDPIGFIDAGHLLLTPAGQQGQTAVYDLATATSKAVTAQGFMAARLPGGL